MTSKTNTFDGQPSGTAWSVANSGGGSGDPWDALNTTGTVTAVYDAAQAAHGAQSLHITAAASSQHILRWTTFSTPTIWCRLYLRLLASNGAQDLLQIRNAGGQAAALGISSTNQLQVKNAPGTGVKNFAALSLGTWYRIQMQAARGDTTANGTLAVSYYQLDADNPVEAPYLATDQNVGTADLVEWRCGKLTSGPTLEAFFDSVTVSDSVTDGLGPFTRQSLRRSRLTRVPSRIG